MLWASKQKIPLGDKHRILRLPDVKARTGLSRSTIYLRLAQGQFPRPVSLGARSIGFVESEVDAWIAERIHLSRETAKQVRP
jgi:prophage regulatory protein